MMCARWKAIAPIVAVTVMVCMAWTGVVRAQLVEQVDTNVAYLKPIYNHPVNCTYYKPTSHYPQTWPDFAPILNDDIWYNSPEQSVYVNRNVDGTMRIDLTGAEGVTMDVTKVQLFPAKFQPGVYTWEPYLTGCYLEAGDTTACDDYSIEIPAATLQAGNVQFWRPDLNWTGVRYIRVRDTINVLDGLGNDTIDDDLRMTELRVRATVDGYEGFIGDVTAVASHGYTDNCFAEPENMVNNTGMTDQGGAGVGNRNAKSISTAGNYFSQPVYSLDPDPYVDFDLGGTYTLEEMLVWNYSFASTAVSYNYRGTKEVTLEYSDDGGSTWETLDDTNGDDPGTHTFAKAPDEPNDTTYRMYDYQTSVDFGGVTATDVRMTQHSAYGPDGTYELRGLAEVRFYTEGITPPPIPGDTNNDGFVNETDATKLAENWGSAAAPYNYAVGNFNNDNVVDALDAAIMAANWGNHNESEGTAVPEPSALVLLFTSALALCVRRRS